jgi:hypothetical protein
MSALGLFLVPAVLLAFATAGFAQAIPPGQPSDSPEKKSEATPKWKEKIWTRRLDGKLVAVDPKAGTLRVKTMNGETSFTVEGNAAKVRLGRAKVGQAIGVIYYEKDGKLIAKDLKGGLGTNEGPK